MRKFVSGLGKDLDLVAFVYSNVACLLQVKHCVLISNELLPVFFRLHSVFGTPLCWILIYVLLTTAFNYGIGKYLPGFCSSFQFYCLTSACVCVGVLSVVV